jgi:leader peptidase (prepilin peptidase)/N-methyltransferase
MLVMNTATLVGGAIVGSVAGSAAGAAMHRWPAGRTLRSPSRSACAECGVSLAPRDLIPVISWILLVGRCRACASPIDRRLPVLEAGSAAIFAWMLIAYGITPVGVLLAVGAVAVIVAALIDLEHRIVPDRLTIPLAVLAVAALPVLVEGASIGPAAAWALGLPLALRLVNAACDLRGLPRPLGGGDVKLLVGVLALSAAVPLGPPTVLLLALVVGGVVASFGLLIGRLERRGRVPFAPAIAGGFLMTVLAPRWSTGIVAILGGAPWQA